MGKSGEPGELKGIFLESNEKLGTVDVNTEFGIYGKIYTEPENRSSEPVQVATRAQVKEGPAIILANIEGDKVEEFAIEIQKVSRQNTTSSKGMIIRVLDERLLNETGGIVQGMSGSPILQNGKLVGAVTHVLVNDPTRGYGIFAEWMLQNMSERNEDKKAG
jgi:stage IV sporulation protein B